MVVCANVLMMGVQMLKKRYVWILFGLMVLLSGCGHFFNHGNIQKAGMLVETSVNDQAWEKKNYKGLLAIRDKYDVDIYYREGIKTEKDVQHAVEELVNKGVNLIFGESSSYGKAFVDISQQYPEVQFVYFNGDYYAENVASLNFNTGSMSFFGGMIAGKMTETNQVGVLAEYEWQPGVEEFFDGVKYQNPDAEVHINYVKNLDDKENALTNYKKMRKKDVDVVYPASESFRSDIIKRASRDGIYAFGNVDDRSVMDDRTVLTSVVLHVDKLYELMAKRFNKGEMTDRILTYDFKDEAITLGEFSPDVPEAFQEKIRKAVATYKKTGLLPNEQK